MALGFLLSALSGCYTGATIGDAQAVPQKKKFECSVNFTAGDKQIRKSGVFCAFSEIHSKGEAAIKWCVPYAGPGMGGVFASCQNSLSCSELVSGGGPC
jgi:hypothetical protein